MNRHDPIVAADALEEKFATDSLRLAADKDELIAAWWSDCEHFEGAARERLQEEYSLRLRELGLLVLE